MTFDSTRQPAETGFSYPGNDAAQAPEGTQATSTHNHYTTNPLSPDFDKIPSELRALPYWLCWQLETRDGRSTKVPKCAHTGRNASTIDASTWCDFSTAITAYQQRQYSGIGLVLRNDLVGIDLDHVIDSATGEIEPRAMQIIARFQGTYCEVSPSGTGIRIFCRGKPGRTGKNEGPGKWLEVYDHTSPRYLTVTGNHWHGTATAVTVQQAALDWLYENYFVKPAKAKPDPATRPAPDLGLDDATLLEKARSVTNGDKFIALFDRGDTSAYGSQSEADLVLCAHLAFWTGKDPGRMDRLFRQSGLMREKWNRADYRQRTIDKAVDECREVYTGEGRKARGNGHDLAPPDPAQDAGQYQISDDHWPRLEPEDKPPHIATDQANGYRIAQHVGRDLLYVVRIGWHSWRGTHWHLGEEFAYRKVQRLSRLILAESAAAAQKAADTEDSEKRKELMGISEALTGWASKSEARDRIYAAMTLAKPMLVVEHEELDQSHWLLNCTNGTVDLRTGQLRPHRRDDFITRCIPVAYDPQATCPTWLKFLDRIFTNVADVIDFVQKAIGYAMTGDTSEQCVFFLWGGGHNGKSTLLSVVQALMGAYAQQAAPDLLVVSKHERHTTEIAELRGARLVASIETGDGRRLNEPLIKQMSGGDRMKGRFMRQDNIEFDPTFKVFLATNHKPKIRGTDYAIWRRIRLIPFTVTIPPEERDPKFPEKLKTELPGILVWAVRGCLAWQREGLEPPKEVVEATNQYKAESDVVAKFLTECCVLTPNARAKARDLYKAYSQWCEQTGECVTETETSFCLKLSERGFEKRRLTAGMFYEGIGLQASGYEEGEL